MLQSDAERLSLLQKQISGAEVVKGSLVRSMETGEPGMAIEELRNLGDAIRKLPKDPEGFK